MTVHKKISKADLILKVIDEQDIKTALEIVCDIGQYQNVVYHLAFRTNSPFDMPFLKSTYPFSWLGRYLEKQYHEIDPVVNQGFQRDEPFFWSELKIESEAHKEFFKDAYEQGAGRSGFSIPLVDKSQRKAMFTVTSNLTDKYWRTKIETERANLAQIGDILHRKAILHVYGSSDGPSLAPREIECLYWTAQGKDVLTVAEILHISEHTVRDYLKTAASNWVATP